jgi:hypothetical protein
MKDITYKVGNLSEIFDEKGNVVTMLRKVAWGDKEEKLELRKWIVDINKEMPHKGFAFLTPEGPHKLTKVLIENGYGHTEELITAMKDREDFKDSLVNVIGEKEVSDIKKTKVKSEYYDPKDMLR